MGRETMSSSRKLRILFLSSHYGIGAAESLWLQTAACMARAGHDVTAAVCWQRWDPARVSELRELGVPVKRLVHSLPMQRLFRPFFARGKAEQSLVRRLTSGAAKPDLVLVSQGNDHSCLPWLEALQTAGIRTAVVTHGIVSSDWPNDRQAERLRRVFSRVAASFWVSKGNQSDFEIQIGQRLPQGCLVWNPIKVKREPLPWPQTHDDWRLACVARIQTRPKGHDLLIQALAGPQWRDRNLTLSIFGEGENRQGLERLAVMLGIPDKVRFPGHVESVEEIWRDHHMIAQPSRNEGMPLSLIEALMCARPALATDVAGHAEVVRDGLDGFIAEAPSVRHINEALERAWQRRAEWQQMGINAAKNLLQIIPPDPVEAFAESLCRLVTPGEPVSDTKPRNSPA
ncbi:glycosyltransferase family 4 protein [Prosthecobacter sp.]|uniref:glycosyltransferase family 4 protein n=1 Tax=Prosthecobacter sp. TaxID=1965333 RepID=UPI003784631A